MPRSGAIVCGMRRISRPRISPRPAASGFSRSGEGRLGQVWRSAKPIWMVDATTEPEFLRAAAAAKSGLHGAVIFPILLDTEALGVVEFFSRACSGTRRRATCHAVGDRQPDRPVHQAPTRRSGIARERGALAQAVRDVGRGNGFGGARRRVYRGEPGVAANARPNRGGDRRAQRPGAQSRGRTRSNRGSVGEISGAAH